MKLVGNPVLVLVSFHSLHKRCFYILLTSSAKHQLPAEVKLAEALPYLAFHQPPPPSQQILSCIWAKLPAPATAGLVKSPSQWEASSQLVSSPLKQALFCISSTEPPLYASKFRAVAQLSFCFCLSNQPKLVGIQTQA